MGSVHPYDVGLLIAIAQNYGMVRYTFEWDLEKAKSNLAKHGVAFESAATVFLLVRRSIGLVESTK